MKSFIIFLVLGFLLFSCAPKPGNVNYKPSNKQEEVLHVIEVAPKWFKELPEEEKFIYSSATAVSKDYQLSIKKATLIAKVELANRLGGTVNSEENFQSVESYIENKLTISKNFNLSSSSSVNEKLIEGYKIEKTLTVQEGEDYRTFILIKM